jgi:hypothetical protein
MENVGCQFLPLLQTAHSIRLDVLPPPRADEVIE